MVSILFDTNVAEVRDARVRLAMNYAVDRNAIIQQLTAGLAEAPAGQPLIKAMLGHNPNIQPYPFDAARARQLLADAGFPNGFTIDYPYAGFQSSFKPLAEASALYFERVGIRTNIRAVDQAVFLADLRGNTLGAIRLSAFDASSGDPGSTLQSYQSRERGGNGRWSNPRYDELFAQQAAEFDRNRRGQIIQQMMQIMNEDPPGVYFYAFVYNWGVSNRVGNFETYRSAMPLFEKMTMVSE
jgi:peptide/nickel transport system substrate-binding protein